jgi:Superfamily I DNA and RNA helicases
MIEFLPSVPDYAKDYSSQMIWNWIKEKTNDLEGIAYYKYPIVRAATGAIPELFISTRSIQPLAIRCLPLTIEEIKEITNEYWVVNNTKIDSPLLELEDFIIGIKSNFDRERVLRNKFTPKAVFAIPSIKKQHLLEKFSPDLFNNYLLICSSEDVQGVIENLKNDLTDEEWRLTRAVVQGIRPLSSSLTGSTTQVNTIGAAINELDKQIALLDYEQEKVAIPIAPGPQRIRGLAGTGKTVLLAMKAANIHKHYPDKKILFTFNTQSLYNQSKNLITKFYRYHTDTDPDWDMIHIRHGWGSRNKNGVYYDLSTTQGIAPLNYTTAKNYDQFSPFRYVCKKALSMPIEPTYDFILVDEAQDFPQEFFQVLYKLSREPHCIYWAYDELQSLFAIEIPKPEELFGTDDNGSPLITLEGDDYPGPIEKDLILKQSYRCPPQILMVAHAIGLGLYSDTECVQMLQNEDSWNAIGYTLERGKLEKGSEVTIYRPPENSPNRILEIYSGKQNFVEVKIFPTRDDELNWIANSVYDDIIVEKVKPEQIVVISLDSFESKPYFSHLQYLLSEKNIDSLIPGIVDDSSVFAEPGKVTLSSVHRAKGNEAPIIYILSFESLYDYVDPVENRNKAFTSISRAKAFVRISGIGKNMERAKLEIEKTLKNYPHFVFPFPDMNKIKKLDAETGKRRNQLERAKTSIKSLVGLDPEAIAAFKKNSPELFEKLSAIIKGVKDEDQ